MSAARVVHSKRDAHDVYVGRPSKWGNPFSHEDDTLAQFKVATRDEAVDAYAEWIKTQPELLADLHELRDKVLGCWCAPKRCHGDVLLALANPAPRGLAQPVTLSGFVISARPAISKAVNKVVGVICSGNIAADRDQVKSLIEKGLTQREGAVWVCLEPKSDRMTYDVMISLGIEPVVLPMIEGMRVKDADGNVLTDQRRIWRDCEMMSLCDELIVFHKRTGSSPWRDRNAAGTHKNLFVVELGPEPVKRARKTRRPVGA